MLWILEHLDQLNTEAVISFLPRLSEARRNRVLSMKPEGPRVQSVLAELLLRRALREEFGLVELPKIETGEKGKPFFPDHPEIHFNLSHCKYAVACALDSAPVGVDAEAHGRLRRDGALPSAIRLKNQGSGIRERRDGTLPSASSCRGGHWPPASSNHALFRVLSEAERDWVLAGETPEEQDRRFTAIWTCKEAWGKALGLGILYDLKSTGFLPETGNWRQNAFCFTHLSRGEYELTLCSAKPLSIRRLTPSELMNTI